MPSEGSDGIGFGTGTGKVCRFGNRQAETALASLPF
ncbi:hypothetical protein M671_02900 [Neisseria gonorrhoeae CH811]|nr:hypothetical protein T556_05595 [Neisseria gonorrhoeae NG-k51.05]KLS10339.1 hypothetical protein M716_01360 [Neisseria gonorrhoeae SK32402]KLS77776.1 hypothetical protein M771_00270 [Neisseria gonorrhoeae MU_NG1]KLS81012.1 hypothetical protein M786_03060 [Neisseria gonorrhoeae MU_NG21]KLS90716.1 hypothetical protein M775_01905 [Neisseria gonorrhoeae MU_NG6]KLS98301.1 hypothetical protein M671_02900 [Neisseria gonorrhoeae CH811]